MENKQYRIYKLNTFNLFSELENEKYNEIKKNNGSLKELLPLILESFVGQREVNSKSLNMDSEIELFESDLLRVIDSLEQELDFVSDLIFVKVYHHEILKQILERDIICNGKIFTFYTSSSGQMRKQTITLVEKDALEKYRNNLFNGLTTERINQHKEVINDVENNGINLGKFMAYTSLSMSASVPVEIDIDRVIVVPDFETTIEKEVEYIDNKTFKSEKTIMEVPVNHCDGAGMFLPGVLKSSCQIRSRWLKGAIFPFDFKTYALEVAKNTKIKDIYGDEYDVIDDDIQIILSQSQFKMWKYYESWDEYKKFFKENKLTFSITNEANPPAEQTELSYQFLQTLDMSDENLEKICADTVKKIRGLYKDAEEMKKILGATEDNDKLSPLQEALLLYPSLLHDVHIKKQVMKTVSEYRKRAMGGKILADGFYSYIVPDFYAYCERLFQGIEKPQGLIEDGYIYNAHFNDKEIEKADLLRSPHLWNEHCVRNFTRSDECKKWFEHMGTNTIISSHDLTLLTLMADVDGDTCMVCTSEPLISSIRSDVPLLYKMFKANPQEINSQNIYETLIKAFESNIIGEISNAITKLWNVEGEIDFEMIKILQMYNNFTIDYPKTSVNIELPSNIAEKFKQLISDDNPYFFKYAKKKNRYQPLNNSVVNRISNHVRSKTIKLKYKPFQEKVEFNYAMLMDNSKQVRRNRKPYELLQQALFKWDSKIQHLTRKVAEASDEDKELETKFNVVYQYCKDELVRIYGGAKQINYVVNALIDIEYNQPHNVDKQKNILWNCFGDVLVRNLRNNLNSDVEVKARPRLAYSKKENEQYRKIKPKLELMETPKSVDITFNDIELINKISKKNENDGKLFYVLVCLCKAFDNKLVLSKNKKSKVKVNKKSQKKKFILTANRIQDLAGITTFTTAIKRLNEDNVYKDMKEALVTIDDESKKKMIISLNNVHKDQVAFKVENIWNSLFYLKKYQGKATTQCKICGNQFIKEGNTETCSKVCSAEATRRKKKEDYQKAKEEKNNKKTEKIDEIQEIIVDEEINIVV